MVKNDDFGFANRMLAVAAMATGAALLAWNVYRLSLAPARLSWWQVPVAAAGMVAADFLSGLIHWAADTWGSESAPVVGRRFLRPFRVHHVNPDDFLRRRFIDANGDVALLIAPVLAALSALPLDTEPGVTAAVFLSSSSAVGLLTNQIHQWAHMPSPPSIIRVLQAFRLILTPGAHAEHHRPPYAANYCITTGWCNRPLAAIGFFARLERTITRLTGLVPRHDEAAFQATAGAGPPCAWGSAEESDA